MVLSADGHALYFSRSAIPFLRGVEPSQWQSSHTYYKHIGLYAYRSDVLRKITALPQGILERCESLEQLRWLENGYRIRTAVTMTESLAIDTPQDLQAAAVDLWYAGPDEIVGHTFAVCFFSVTFVAVTTLVYPFGYEKSLNLRLNSRTICRMPKH